MIKYIIGPSHCVRLKHAIKTEQIDRFIDIENIDGMGGRPTWSIEIKKTIKNILKNNPSALIYIFVSDFRFGNKIITDDFSIHIKKEYLAVDKNLINEKNDSILFEFCQKNIDTLINDYPENIKLLFWDLALREQININERKYFSSENKYLHPTWNISEINSKYSNVLIGLQFINSTSYQRLFIDSSLHPSLFGFIVIKKIIFHPSNISEDDFNQIEKSYDSFILNLFNSIPIKEKTVITGGSKFTRILQRYINEKHILLPELVKLIPLDSAINKRNDCHVIYFPDIITHAKEDEVVKQSIEKTIAIRDKISCNAARITVFPYDLWAYENISRRKDYKDKFISKTEFGKIRNIEDTICYQSQKNRISDLNKDFESLIELNDTLLPTIYGIYRILGLASDALEDTLHTNYLNLIKNI